MRLFLNICLLFFFTITIHAQSRPERDSLLSELNNTIDKAKQFDAAKLGTINNIKTELSARGNEAPEKQYGIYNRLYEEYKIFRFDTAFLYANKLMGIAQTLNDPNRETMARIHLLFAFVSAGMFKEASGVIGEMHMEGQADSVKATYYSLAARYYFDLADYTNNAGFTKKYYDEGGILLDSALRYFPANSFESIYYNGLRNLKKGNLENAYANFLVLMHRPGLTYHQQALAASTLSGIYAGDGEKGVAMNYQIRAAIADIKSSTKETFAIYSLSQMLFEQGDFENASAYIEKAIDDATFYGARQRKVQVSSILPIIQSSRINFIEGEKRSLLIYGIAVSAILLILFFLVVTIHRQNLKLRQARKELSEAHTRLFAANDKLTEVNTHLYKANRDLNELNHKLLEANKIKEELVGYFFSVNSLFFHKVEKLKAAMEQKLDARKIDELRYIVQKIDIRADKEELLKSFDMAFLKLFPHFVDEFNALLRDEEKITLHENEYLNTDLRIYALLRLGIRENEKIAEILEYSVKSIYAYKTRIRNKAIVPKDDFDKRVMEIKSV